jgi:hypothetical protein
MSATHHLSSSKGPVEIAGMNYRHLQNSQGVLVRLSDPERKPELDAINARIAELEAEFAEQEAEQAVNGHG